MKFPIDTKPYKTLKFSLNRKINKKELTQLKTNIQIVRDIVIFITGLSNAKGVGGHTGGPYDIVPELLIIKGFAKNSKKIHPVIFDAAGHRCAVHYTLSALEGRIPLAKLLHYREYKSELYGHPEITPAIDFASGRLGHLWGHANGVAEAYPNKKIILLSSDGSLEEGTDIEAARYAVAHKLNILMALDENNCTIKGHPKDYMPGYEPAKLLRGTGITVNEGNPEKYTDLSERIRKSINAPGHIALINHR